MKFTTLRSIHVTRYVTPLREGGSLPAIVEADDGFLYVIKFKGAGQGSKALIAELIGGELARALGLLVPEIVLIHLDPALGKTEPDQEIQDLLKASSGWNLGLHYLSGSITFDPLNYQPAALTASKIVWLDAFITNVDRTIKNTNMLMWHKELWLIDHGASLYFHHTPEKWQLHSTTDFPLVKDHVLLRYASNLDDADEVCRQTITTDLLTNVLSQIPNDWLSVNQPEESPEAVRQMYMQYLQIRLQNSKQFVNKAHDARSSLI